MSEYQRKRNRQKQRRHHRAHLRVRQRVVGTSERPRLAVHRSLNNIYVQLIDDSKGVTIAQANSREAAVMDGVETSSGSKAAARRVGIVAAERAKAAGVETVVFDRGGYRYHGRIQEVADGAREGGLKL